MVPEIPRMTMQAGGGGDRPEEIELWMSGVNGASLDVPVEQQMGAEDESGSGFVTGPSPIHERSDQVQTAAPQTDYDVFMSGAMDAAAEGGEQFDFDLGDTVYPFQSGGETFDFDEAIGFEEANEFTEHQVTTAEDEQMQEVPTRAETGAQTAALEILSNTIAEIQTQLQPDVVAGTPEDEEIQQGSPETAVETQTQMQSFGHTQLAELAATGLQHFMGHLRDTTRTEAPVALQEVTSTPPPSAATTGTPLSKTLDLGNLILGKRKSFQTSAASSSPVGKKRSPDCDEVVEESEDAPEDGDGYQLTGEKANGEGATPRATGGEDGDVNELLHAQFDFEPEHGVELQADEDEGVEV